MKRSNNFCSNSAIVQLVELDDPGLDLDLDHPTDYEKALRLAFGLTSARMLASQRSAYLFNPSGTIGSERSRMPVAAKIALPTAGAIPTIGVSPAPADAKSFFGSQEPLRFSVHR
jgi:hypothetical protein